MNEKTKKLLMSLAVRFLVAAGIFAVLFAIDKIFPSFMEKMSGIWTKNINFKRTGKLLLELFNETVPF